MVEQQRVTAPKSIRSATDSSWWLFCLSVLALKFLLLAVDPLPKLFLGDSKSYLFTAIFGWIPRDRSFFYGYVIRLVSIWTASLTPLLILQAFLGAIIAIIVAWICRAIFDLPRTFSYLFGFLCSIDPLQLAWERYVMTETCSLFFYALVLQQSFVYLRDRRITTLLVIQILSVITIGFRMSFLIVIEVMAVALPLIVFVAGIQPTEMAAAVSQPRLQFLKRALFWRHLAASIVTMFLLDQGYQHANGFLSHREPAHIYGTGYFLLAIWAPALQPRDAADPRLREIIEHGSEFELRNIRARAHQRFSEGYLVDRWRHAETDPRQSGEIATRTALNALRRDPVAVIGLAAKTYRAFWSGRFKKSIATEDLGMGRSLTDFDRKLLAERFHWATGSELDPKPQPFPTSYSIAALLPGIPPILLELLYFVALNLPEPQTLTTWYYVSASPYFFLVLLSPVLSLVLLFAARNKAYALLLLVHTVVLLATTFLLSIAPIPRYLHPLSLLTLLSLALAVRTLLDWRSVAQNEDTSP